MNILLAVIFFLQSEYALAYQYMRTTQMINPSEQVPATEKIPTATTTDTVKPWQSKTLWASILVATLPLIPGVGPILSGVVGSNPELAGLIVGGAFGVLRLVTSGKVRLK